MEEGLYVRNHRFSSSDKASRWVMLLFLLIVSLGILLRFYDLAGESIWVDEAFTYHYVTTPLPELVTLLKHDVHPILFYALEHWWIELFGPSEFSLRFLPFIFGSLSIVLMYGLARELFKFRISLLATLFFSLSYTLILYSQEAKMYAQFIFLLLGVLWSYACFLKKPSWSSLFWLSVCSGLLLHTHILSVVVLVPLIFLYFFSYLLQKHQEINFWGWLLPQFKVNYNLKQFWGYVGSLLLWYLPWMPVFFYQFQRLFLDMLPSKFMEKFGFNGFYPLMILAAFLVLTLVSGLFYIVKKTKFRPFFRKIFALRIPSALGVGIFLMYLMINVLFYRFLLGNVPYVRYLLFLLPLFYLWMAYTLDNLNSKKWFMALLVLYLLATSFILIQYYSTNGKEEWREVAAYVSETVGHNDILLFNNGGHTRQAFNYYYPKDTLKIRLDVPEDMTLLRKNVPGHTFAYLIMSHNFKTGDLFKNEMDGKYQLVDSREFIGIKMYKYLLGKDG